MKLFFLTVLAIRAFSQVCAPIPAWSVCELRFPGVNSPLQGQFRSPTHKTLLIRSFSESQTQVFRVVPTEAGIWDYRIEGKEGSFTATSSNAPGYVEAANIHHFRYTGSKQPHLWMGGVAPGENVSVRARQHFTHIRIAADTRLDAEILAIHNAGLTADLVVPVQADSADLVARYGALNVTWQVPEGSGDLAARIKFADQYNHLLNFRTYQSSDGDVVAVEHQIYPSPAVNDFGAGLTDVAQFRHALWRTTMDGGYPESHVIDETAAVQMQHWYEFFASTRHWELEPFFDAGGRRALALEGVEYIIYAETPGPVEVTVEKHNYDVEWFNPLSGERVQQKNLKTDTFTGEPPDTSHDWVLHISREGHKEGMLKSYKFESRELLMQEAETSPAKMPFEITEPAGDSISLKQPGAFSVKLTKETKAARAMRYIWTGEVTADGGRSRVLGTGAQGKLTLPADIAAHLPALLHLCVAGLNGVGKLYLLDRNYQLTD